MSNISQYTAPPSKQRRNNISIQSLAENSTRPTSSDPDVKQTIDHSLIPKDINESKKTNRYGKIIAPEYSVSSLSSSASISESSSSVEMESSDDQPSEISDEADNDKFENNLTVKEAEIKKGGAGAAPVVPKSRLWSYIKSPLKIFRKEVTGNAEIDNDSDLPIYIDYVDTNYSGGTTKLIKKLTNLYMMLCDPDIGIIKHSSKSKNSFSGEELYKWIYDNFDSNQDDYLSFLRNRTDVDEIDALTICNIIFLAGFIVPLDKSYSKFVLDDSEYILQAPYFIPLSTGVPSDIDYARYLIRRGNSNKFKLHDYELKVLEEYKKSMKSSWKEIENLAQQDTAGFRRRPKDDIHIFKLQQQTFWRIYRPGPDSYDFFNQADDVIRRRRKIIFSTKGKDFIKQPRLKMGKACKYIKDYSIAVSYIDPFLQKESNTNPWISGDTSIWDSDRAISPAQIYLWTTGIFYLLHDTQGLLRFNQYLKNEFSQENLNFILACRELEKTVTLKEYSILAKQIYRDYIMSGSPYEINIVSSIRNNLIAVLEPIINNGNELMSDNYDIYSDAASHILMLLEKDPYKRYCKVLRAKLPDNVRSSRRLLSKSHNQLSNLNPDKKESTYSLKSQKDSAPNINSSSNIKSNEKKYKNNVKSDSSLRKQ